ncbi:MAG: hypothetical protein M0Z46_04180 [Actinomycetota bacterium]|nr:hypothetical protein [Actinomycetota bacterium]
MWSVKVNRDELLKVIEQNRAHHHEVFEKALGKFREAVLEDFEAKIEILRKGKIPDTYLRLTRPEDHTGTYDTVIGMLKMSTDEVVELGTDEYANYVQDQWSWTRQFRSTAASYGVRA